MARRPVQIPFERRCDACVRWHLMPGFTVRGAPADDDGAKSDVALPIHEEDAGKQQVVLVLVLAGAGACTAAPWSGSASVVILPSCPTDAVMQQQIHGEVSMQIAEIDGAAAAVQRAADKSVEDSLKPQHALHNPLDNWDHISASNARDCHKCLATHSSLWHLHLDLPTCHSCYVDLYR